MKLAVLFVIYIINTQVYINTSSEYYWRDYDGHIPCDAVQGGTDRYGHYTYIGQFPIKDDCEGEYADVVSSTIHPGNMKSYSAYGDKVVDTTKSIKILCASELEKYSWINSYERGCELIRGSTTSNYSEYYIGRTVHEGHNVTGRFSAEIRKLAIALPGPSPTVIEKDKFEMLAYCEHL